MGLSMTLEGRTSNWFCTKNDPMSDGFRILGVMLDLGYWRNYRDLHEYIVNTFAEGVVDCGAIVLTADQMRQIIKAIKCKELPHTEKSFFGNGDGSEDASSIEILKKAIAWVEAESEGVSKEVFYYASW